MNEPIWTVPQWRQAVEAAGGQCQCAEKTRGHGHHTHDQRCPRTHQDGTRLYLGTDGRVRCPYCHNHAEKTARATAAQAARDADDSEALF